MAAMASACATTPQAQPEAATPETTARTQPHVVRELASRLRVGADSCVVARPAALTEEERGLYVAMAQSEALAWLPDLAVDAYTRVERRRRGRPASVISELRVGVPLEHVRSELDAHAALDLQWTTEPLGPCTPDACPTQASSDGEGHVRLARGEWASTDKPGVERRCRRLLREHPDAVEVWARRERSLRALADTGPPLLSTAVITRAPNGLRIEREDLMPSVAAAERGLSARRLPTGMPSRFGVLAPIAVKQRVDASVLVTLDVAWEDLLMLRDDEERQASAKRYADALARLQPDDAEGMLGTNKLVTQIEVRLTLLEEAVGEHPALVASVRALLERLAGVQPNEPRLSGLRERFARSVPGAAPTPR
jgi:hypothetical protein